MAWKDLDYLVIDLPPGTGDVALSLSQTVPSPARCGDDPAAECRWQTRGGRSAMCLKLNIPPIGVVRNMSYSCVPIARTKATSSAAAAREQMATDRAFRSSEEPIYQPIREGGDRGVPIVISEPDSAARAFMAAAEQTGRGVDRQLQTSPFR